MKVEYAEKVAAFVRTGAALIRADVRSRYRAIPPWSGKRPLEPGFIPPDLEARVTVISWYPNEGDLRGGLDYAALRDRFDSWGRDGTMESYRLAYEDWIKSLDAIHFYSTHTLPVISALGMSAREIAWIPLIKVPMPRQANPPDAVVDRDREDTWAQMHLLKPGIVWIQGVTTTAPWIERQVREQLTDRVAVQDINERRTKADRQAVVDAVVAKLRRFLSDR